MFEKALGEATVTPTDDEREELALVIEQGWGNPTWDGKTLRPIDRQIADAVLAAGFRRSEVPEPSADWRISGLIERAQSIVNQMKSSTGRRTSPDEWCYVRFGQVSALEEVLRVMSRVSVPLDAVVEAGADELWRRLTRIGTAPGPTMSECQDIMRAALRAALSLREGDVR